MKDYSDDHCLFSFTYMYLNMNKQYKHEMIITWLCVFVCVDSTRSLPWQSRDDQQATWGDFSQTGANETVEQWCTCKVVYSHTIRFAFYLSLHLLYRFTITFTLCTYIYILPTIYFPPSRKKRKNNSLLHVNYYIMANINCSFSKQSNA